MGKSLISYSLLRLSIAFVTTGLSGKAYLVFSEPLHIESYFVKQSFENLSLEKVNLELNLVVKSAAKQAFVVHWYLNGTLIVKQEQVSDSIEIKLS